MTTVCLRCSAEIDDGDYCAACIGTATAEAWHAQDVIAAYVQTIGPVPPRPEDGE
ncbi:MAG: hypothetical protein WA208_21695 [Thermoanaerobaculia bacterium]